MKYSATIISIIENIILMLPALLVVAYVTVAERKTMASMQRRLGPNAVGYYGLLQAFADALKLILKEYVAPTQANLILFFFRTDSDINICFIGLCGYSLWSWFIVRRYGIRYIVYASCFIFSYLWYFTCRMKC